MDEHTLPDETSLMDDLWSSGVDQEEAERAEKEMLPLDGTYQTVPPWIVEGKHFAAADGRPARLSFTAYGESVHTRTGQTERLRLRFSPQLQKKDDDKYDASSKNYLALAKVYRGLYEYEGRVTAGQIKEMLEHFPVGLYGRRFDGYEGPQFYINNIFRLKVTE